MGKYVKTFSDLIYLVLQKIHTLIWAKISNLRYNTTESENMSRLFQDFSRFFDWVWVMPQKFIRAFWKMVH